MSRLTVPLLAVLVSLSSLSGKTSDFVWRNLDNSKTALFVPADWKMSRQLGEYRDVYSFVPTGPFDGINDNIAVMVVIYKEYGKRLGVSPSTIAQDPAAWVKSTWKGGITRATRTELGPFKGMHLRFHFEGMSFLGEEFLLANDETDQLWSVSFLSPKANWARSWMAYGNPILNAVMLDDEYGTKGFPN